MRTQLELVSSGIVDLYDDIDISLTYSIYDIENPEKRMATYSKTIIIPGTSNNNSLFRHIYNIDAYSNFNPNNKANINLYDNQVLVLEGYLKLNNIVNNEGKIEYECVVYGNIGNIFVDIGDNLLSDLDFSDLDHIYNATNVENSWSAPVGEGYVYPLIDYGDASFTPNFNQGATDVGDYRPAIYVKEYIDRIFSTYGYTYSSPFFESDFFKRLIVPYTRGNFKLTEAQVAERLFNVSVSQTYTQSLPYEGTIGEIPIDLTSTVSNGSSVTVDLTNDIIYLSKAGYYTVSLNVLSASYTAIVPQVTSTIYLWVEQSDPTFTGRTLVSVEIVSAGAGVFTSNPIYFTPTASLRIYMTIYNVISTTLSLSLTNSLSSNLIVEGENIVLDTAIPSNIKQKDFLLSIFKMFNLMVDRDVNLSKKYTIEPRNDFYSSGVVTDWDSKVDYSKPVEIKPLTDSIVSKYIYKYKSDSDYYNKLYQDRYGEPYGSKIYNTNFSLVNGEKSTEVIFSPTPTIYKKRMFMASLTTNGTSTGEFNIRILYYAGLVNAPLQFRFNGVAKTQYPQATHTDNPNTPYRDLSFGAPKEVYYAATQWTNQNLFLMYHFPQLAEITASDSRIVEAYIKLTPSDILSLDFRNIFYFDLHYLRLLSIENYKLGGNDTYKCKFLKIRYKDVPHSSNYTAGTYSTFGGWDTTLADMLTWLNGWSNYYIVLPPLGF